MVRNSGGVYTQRRLALRTVIESASPIKEKARSSEERLRHAHQTKTNRIKGLCCVSRLGRGRFAIRAPLTLHAVLDDPRMIWHFVERQTLVRVEDQQLLTFVRSISHRI